MPLISARSSTVFGNAGPIFITVAMTLFAFTTLLGNLYYVDNALIYINNKVRPKELTMKIFYVVCAMVIFFGAVIPMDAAWATADITMGLMTLIMMKRISISSCRR